MRLLIKKIRSSEAACDGCDSGFKFERYKLSTLAGGGGCRRICTTSGKFPSLGKLRSLAAAVASARVSHNNTTYSQTYLVLA